MRAIIIEDKDCKALLEKLKLESFRKDCPGIYDTRLSDVWNALPEGDRKQIIDGMHGRFHYVLTGWLQEQGGKVI